MKKIISKNLIQNHLKLEKNFKNLEERKILYVKSMKAKIVIYYHLLIYRIVCFRYSKINTNSRFLAKKERLYIGQYGVYMCSALLRNELIIYCDLQGKEMPIIRAIAIIV